MMKTFKGWKANTWASNSILPSLAF